MALYPSLEDMKVDHLVQAQREVSYSAQPASIAAMGPGGLGVMYPALTDFMGLELTQEMIAINMPEYSQNSTSMAMLPAGNMTGSNVIANMVAPLSGNSTALQKSFVTQGIRQVVLCKDDKGKIGLRLRAVSNGLFVCLVMKDSVAALAGLRFGDQVLEINDKSAAGMTMDEAHKLLKQAPVNGIRLSIRDRPFERTLTLHKDSLGHIGFHFKDGQITGLVKDSSAARNGLLIDHQLVEVNGQNVVGLKDKEIAKIIESGDGIVTITIIPSSIYKHMIKKMATNLLKNSMDHTPAV